jgi:sterol desaturase/sphingolipid hydroxylase (fatty acid hydroxylase superfamily)
VESIDMDGLWELIASIAVSFGKTLIGIAPYVAVAAVVFPILSVWFACNSLTPWWRRRELVTDLCYWFVIPIFTRFMRIGLMVLGAALLFGIYAAEDIVAFYDNGHGPLAELPFWIQLGIYLVVSDFILYWSHRLFHGVRLWKYHAIHHSPEDVDWISAARFHPVNLTLGAVLADVVLLLAGIAPAVLSILTPFNVIMSAFVHANLNWTLGPFKYVIAGPVFHRWHHTAADRGGSMNFAPTFPVLDLLFGTFYMPKNELPSEYGIGEPDFPSSFGGQLLYPFRNPPAAAASPAAPAHASAKS